MEELKEKVKDKVEVSTEVQQETQRILVGRLRYLSMGEVYHYNEDSEELDEIIECEELPYINTQVKATKARRLVYGSN